MSDRQRGTDRAGRRRKRLLRPTQKYEIWVQLLRGETTIFQAADRAGVDLLDMPGVDQLQVEPGVLEHIPRRPPVPPGGLHRHA